MNRKSQDAFLTIASSCLPSSLQSFNRDDVPREMSPVNAELAADKFFRSRPLVVSSAELMSPLSWVWFPLNSVKSISNVWFRSSWMTLAPIDYATRWGGLRNFYFSETVYLVRDREQLVNFVAPQLLMIVTNSGYLLSTRWYSLYVWSVSPENTLLMSRKCSLCSRCFPVEGEAERGFKEGLCFLFFLCGGGGWLPRKWDAVSRSFRTNRSHQLIVKPTFVVSVLKNYVYSKLFEQLVWIDEL